MSDIITLTDLAEKIKLRLTYDFSADSGFVVHTVQYWTGEVFEDISDKFNLSDIPNGILGYELRLTSAAIEAGFAEKFGMTNPFEYIALRPSDFDRHGKNALLGSIFGAAQFHWIETERAPEKPIEKPITPRYKALAKKLKQHAQHFDTKKVARRGKDAFLKATQPVGLAQEPPGLANLNELAQFQKTSGEFNTRDTNDYLAASAFHRWFPTRQHILPKHFGELVRKNSELQNRRVLELWIEHYTTRLNNKLRMGGRKKATTVNCAWRGAKAFFEEVSISDPTPEVLVNLLTVAKPGEKSLIDAIATPRTYKWRVGNMSFGFKKLFKDFPVLDEYKEFLRFHVWIKQYCESLGRVHFNAKPEKVAAIQAALARANEAAKQNPNLRKSLFNFLNYNAPEPNFGSVYQPSLLDAIQEKRNPEDKGVSHGYEMLCRGFKELKLQKWLMDYCRVLTQVHLRAGGDEKAKNIREAQKRMNQYLASHGGFTSIEDFLKYKVEGQPSLIEAIQQKRLEGIGRAAVSRGFDRLCREFGLKPADLAPSDIEMQEMRPSTPFSSEEDTDSPGTPEL